MTTTATPRFVLCAYTATGEFAGWYTGESIGTLTFNMARASWSPSEASAEQVLKKRQLETAAGWKAYLWVVEQLPAMATGSVPVGSTLPSVGDWKDSG